MSAPDCSSAISGSNQGSSPDNSESIAVKRVPVTYGRRRPGAAEDNTSVSSYLTTTEIYKATSPFGTTKGNSRSKLLAGSSEAECADDENDDEEQRDASPKFIFDWQKKLKEIDNEDEYDSPDLPNPAGKGIAHTEQRVAELPLDAESKLSKEQSVSVDDFLGGTLRSKISNPSTPEIRPRTRNRAVIHDSDSESELLDHKLESSANTSPPLIFRTPNSGSSPTPPTSDDEMPSRPTSKGKGKAITIIRRSVPPLQLEEPLSGAESGSGGSISTGRRPRLKAPTKKELKETVKERARLAADQCISIPLTENSRKFTVQTLFASIAETQKETKLPSDPILPFSSSPAQQEGVQRRVEGTGVTSSGGRNPKLGAQSVEKQEMLKELAAKKRRVLASRAFLEPAEEDEDDLEIVTGNTLPTKHGSSSKKLRPALQCSVQKPANKLIRSFESGGNASKILGEAKGLLTQAELNRLLLARVQQQDQEMRKSKDDEFVSSGGQLRNYPAEVHIDRVRTYVKKGLENTTKESKDVGVDLDFLDHPIGSDAETADSEFEEIIANIAGETQGDNGPPDDEVEAPMIRARNRRAVAVIDSDSENEKRGTVGVRSDTDPARFGQRRLGITATGDERDGDPSSSITFSLSIHRDSVSSLEDLAEDRSDKENNQKLMFDRSEDKENKVVTCHEGLPSPGSKITNSRVSISPISFQKNVGDEEVAQRSPFTTLSEDKLTLLQPGSSWVTSRLDTCPTIAAGASVSDQKESLAHRALQFGGGPFLEPGFADLFESGTEKGNGANSSTFNCTELDDLDLTQDIILQPAFRVEDQVQRQAESIFEKEQAFLLEAANKKAQKKQYYVNEFGFLTQTRPSDENIELYKSPLVSQRTVHDASLSWSTKSSQRRPLSTLSFSAPSAPNDEETLYDAPRRRLMKRSTVSPNQTVSIGHPDSPTPRQKNAFDVLALGSKSFTRQEKPKNKLDKCELVEAEAEESDDDEFGLGLKRGDEDEEDGEDLDRTLEGLVDDREMDEQTLAEQRVLEKYQEHVGQDDQELEKLHQAAAQGELRRKKRKGGIELDDSEEEGDEDERIRRIRRRMNKRQRIDRDNIKALAENEETMPFYKVYEHDLVDDDLMEPQQQDTVMTETPNDDYKEYVTREEIESQARELARSDAESAQDHYDVSWVDGDQSDDETGIEVKIINATEKKGGQGRSNALYDLDEALGIGNRAGMVEGEADKIRAQKWAGAERRRGAGAAALSGGVAVTGHGKGKAKGSRLRERSPPRKPLKATPSVLASVCNRHERFG